MRRNRPKGTRTYRHTRDAAREEASRRGPRSERVADLPLVSERINESADSPSVFVLRRRRLDTARRDASAHHRVGIIDDQKKPGCCSPDGNRAEALHIFPSRRHPEHCVADGELHNDVISFTDTVKDRCPESLLVERNRLTGVFNPQLRLNARHTFRLEDQLAIRKAPD